MLFGDGLFFFVKRVRVLFAGLSFQTNDDTATNWPELQHLQTSPSIINSTSSNSTHTTPIHQHYQQWVRLPQKQRKIVRASFPPAPLVPRRLPLLHDPSLLSLQTLAPVHRHHIPKMTVRDPSTCRFCIHVA